jgi:hypothetical protein
MTRRRRVDALEALIPEPSPPTRNYTPEESARLYKEMREALRAEPHEWPDDLPDVTAREALDAYTELIRDSGRRRRPGEPNDTMDVFYNSIRHRRGLPLKFQQGAAASWRLRPRPETIAPNGRV